MLGSSQNFRTQSGAWTLISRGLYGRRIRGVRRGRTGEPTDLREPLPASPGELPAVRVGARRVRIPESNFNPLVAAREMRALADSDPEHPQQ
jgi:hypothetical protein